MELWWRQQWARVLVPTGLGDAGSSHGRRRGLVLGWHSEVELQWQPPEPESGLELGHEPGLGWEKWERTQCDRDIGLAPLLLQVGHQGMLNQIWNGGGRDFARSAATAAAAVVAAVVAAATVGE